MATASITETRDWNRLLTTTIADTAPMIVENELNHHPLASILAGKIGVQLFGQAAMSGKGKRYKVGESIEVRARLGRNETVQAMTPYSTFDTTPSNAMRLLRANWKQYGGTIVIPGRERRANRGAAQIADLVGELTVEAVGAMVDTLNQHLFNNAGNPLRTASLADVVSANDTLQNASGATFTGWNSRGLSAKGTAPASISFTGGSFAVRGIQDMRTAWIGAEEGMMKPQVLLTDDATFSYYEGSLVPEIRYSQTRIGDAGFEQLVFKTAPIFHDSHCTSGALYLLNLDHLFLAVDEMADFTVTPMNEQDQQDVFVAKVLLDCNLVCDMRKAQNKILSITA